MSAAVDAAAAHENGDAEAVDPACQRGSDEESGTEGEQTNVTRYITHDEYQELVRHDYAGPKSSLLAETQERWPVRYWSLELDESGGTVLVPTMVCQEITVPRTQLQPGDLWWFHDGWHRVISNENNQPGNQPGLLRTSTKIQAVSKGDGARAWGTREWDTGLCSDLAEKDMCQVRRPLA